MRPGASLEAQQGTDKGPYKSEVVPGQKSKATVTCECLDNDSSQSAHVQNQS